MASKHMHGFPPGKHDAAVTQAVSLANKILPRAKAADIAEDKRDHGRDESRERT